MDDGNGGKKGFPLYILPCPLRPMFSHYELSYWTNAG